MARLLLIHPSRSAIEREVGEGLLAGLRAAGLEAELCSDTPGLAWLDHELSRCTGVVLIEPGRGWIRSGEDALARVWLARIRDHVEFDRRNRLGRVAGIVATIKSTHADLAGLRWFRGAREWDALLEWANAQVEPERAFDFGLEPATPGDRRRDDLLDAIDDAMGAALGSAERVLVRGPMGSGKTRVIRDWLGRGASSWIVAHHFALPEHGATQSAELARRSLARQLDPSASSLDEALDHALASGPQARGALVVDGLERIDEVQALLALSHDHATRVVWLLAARPGHAPLERATTIDLDAPTWTSTAALIEALAAEVPRLGADERELLIQRAAGNPSYVAALAAEAGGRTTKAQLEAMTHPAGVGRSPELPRGFAAELARALGRLAGLSIEPRRRAGLILDLLALCDEPLPGPVLRASLAWLATLDAAIEPVRGLVRLVASESSSEAEPSVALFHPALRDSLRIEIDDRSATERRLLDGIERTGSDASGPSLTLQASIAPLLQRQLDTNADWLRDLTKLAEVLQTRGPLELERELELLGEGLASDVLAIVRANQPALLRDPAGLPTLVWNGLLDRKWTTTELREQLRWPGGLPRIRLRRPLDVIDHCWRSIAHPEPTHGCAISSDGSLVLSACDDGRIRLWSRASGEQLALFEQGGLARALAMTPDGRWAVSAGTSTPIKLWDLQARKLAGECDAAKSYVVALAIDDQASCVFAGDDEGRLLIWRPTLGRVERLGGHSDRIRGLAITSDGKRGLSAGGDRSQIWELDRATKTASFDHEHLAGPVAIAGDRGHLLAIGESLRVSLSEGKVEATYSGLGRNAECCVCFDQGRRLISGEGKCLILYDAEAGRILQSLHAHSADVEGCAATPTGDWIVSVGDSQLKIWPREVWTRPAIGRWSGSRNFVVASPNGRQAIVGGDEYPLAIVEVGSGQVIGHVEPEGRTNAVAWIDDDRFVCVGATSHELSIWSVAARTQAFARELGSDWLRCAAISPDRRFVLVAGDQKQTWLIALDDPSRQRSLGGHSDWVHACCFSSDGERAMAVDGDAHLKIWSVTTRKQLHALESEKEHSYAAIASIGELAFVGGPSRLEVWDIDAGKLLASQTAHAAKIRALALADEGRVLVSASEDATLRLWRVGREPSLLATVSGHAAFTGVTLAGSLLLASDAAGNVWELEVDWRSLD